MIASVDFNSIGWVVVLALVLATIIEAMVEYILGVPFDKFPALTPYKWMLTYVSMLAGALLAFFYSIDLIALIANNAGGSLPVSWVGMLLSGLLIGRGANFINDFVSRWFAKQ